MPSRKARAERCIRQNIMPETSSILLGVAGLLTAWLSFRIGRRLRASFSRGDLTGHGIDVTFVAKRLQSVRKNYPAELRRRSGHSPAYAERMARVRRFVSQFSYFRIRARRMCSATDPGTAVVSRGNSKETI